MIFKFHSCALHSQDLFNLVLNLTAYAKAYNLDICCGIMLGNVYIVRTQLWGEGGLAFAY